MTDWPEARGEMAGAIRRYDWATTPLGAIATWPERLKLVTEMMLANGFPMIVLWGPDLIQIYNDGYRQIMANKHPAGLGQPTRECWPEVWHINAPIYRRVWAGETLTFEDGLYPLTRSGRLEDAWFTLTYSPLRGDAGDVVGVLVTLYETTQRILAERALAESQERQAFLLALSDALRPLHDPVEIQMTAATMLGRHLGANRVAYAEDGGDGETVVLARNYTEGVPDITGVYRYADYGEELLRELRAGRSLVRPDIANDTSLDDAEKEAHATLQLGATLNVPLVKDDRLVAILAVHYAAAHPFPASEVTLVENVGERIWAAVERARAEARLRDSEARLAQELESTRRLQQVSSLLLGPQQDGRIFDQILDTAMAITQADFGSMQLLDPERDELRLIAARNFHPDSEAFWQTVSIETGSACGSALRHGERVIIPDIATSEVPIDPRSLHHFRLSGIAAVQSLPLTTRDGRSIGMISTHWRAPRMPSEGELRLLDILARQAADFFERSRVIEALRDSQARFAQFAAASSGALWIRDAQTLAMEYASPAIGRIYGVEPDALLGDLKRWAATIVPDDRDAALAQIEKARRGDAVTHDFRIQRASDRAFVWIRNTAFPLRDADGRVQRVGGIFEDVTEAKLAVEHQAVLLSELQHRVRNIMAILRAIVGRTGARADNVADYTQLMSGRLLALARVQALLTRAASAGVGIRTIVQDELSAQTQHRSQYALAGDDIELSPKTAEVLTLAIHELATNAVKYGALSNPEGKITVSWQKFRKADANWLALNWSEDGAPESSGPPRRGFGTELIEGRIPYELGGLGRLAIGAGGAKCRLEFPLKNGASVLETDAPQRAFVFGGSIDMKGEANLGGHRILVVEDDYYLATDTARALEGAGGIVLGPCATEEAALAEIAVTQPNAAVIDINLGTGPSFKLAAVLKARGVPLLFVTGYDDDIIPEDLADIRRLQKPTELRQIVAAVAEAVGIRA